MKCNKCRSKTAHSTILTNRQFRMLIFWKLVILEDAPLYNKDFSSSHHAESLLATLGNKTYVPTRTDKLINQVAGTTLMACFVLSSTLNYLVYRFNKLKQANLTNFLFKSLSLVDLLTTVYAPWLYASLMFSSELYPCRSTLATFTRQLVCILGCTSQVITWMLAVTRFFRVILPFARIGKKFILVYIAVYCGLMTVNSTCSLAVQITGTGERMIMSVLVHFCFLVNLVHCSTGIIFSIVTSVYLVWCTYIQTLTLRQTFQEPLGRSIPMIRQRMRSCVTILLMNIPYLTSICFIAYANAKPGQISFHDVLFGFLPILTSTINPIIVTARNYRKMKTAILQPQRASKRSYVRSYEDVGATDTSRVAKSPHLPTWNTSPAPRRARKWNVPPSPVTVRVSIQTGKEGKETEGDVPGGYSVEMATSTCTNFPHPLDTTTISVKTTFCNRRFHRETAF